MYDNKQKPFLVVLWSQTRCEAF